MIYLIPFINAFLLIILTKEGQIFHKYYEQFVYNIAPRLPIPSKVLGGCAMCTAFWMGVLEYVPLVQPIELIYFVPYNAVLTAILYKHLDT